MTRKPSIRPFAYSCRYQSGYLFCVHQSNKDYAGKTGMKNRSYPTKRCRYHKCVEDCPYLKVTTAKLKA